MFSFGALLPIILIFIVNLKDLVIYESVFTLFTLMFMGAIAAKAGGADMKVGAMRVALWGAGAMGFTFFVGWLLGA